MQIAMIHDSSVFRTCMRPTIVEQNRQRGDMCACRSGRFQYLFAYVRNGLNDDDDDCLLSNTPSRSAPFASIVVSQFIAISFGNTQAVKIELNFGILRLLGVRHGIDHGSFSCCQKSLLILRAERSTRSYLPNAHLLKRGRISSSL